MEQKFNFCCRKPLPRFQFSGGYSFGFKRGDFIHIQSDIIFDQYHSLKNMTLISKNRITYLLIYLNEKFGQIGVFFGLGVYLHSPFKKFIPDWTFVNNGSFFYNRIGSNIMFKKYFHSNAKAIWELIIQRLVYQFK